jgi:hypothetical protein
MTAENKPNRAASKSIQALVTPEEADAIEVIRRDRKMSLRDLVVSTILGSKPSDEIKRICELEAAVVNLKAEIAELRQTVLYSSYGSRNP